MKQRIFIIFLLLACAFGVIAEEPIKIGASLSLSGQYSDTGKMILYGYRLWEKQINSSRGLLDRTVEVIILDDKGLPEEVRRNYRELIHEQKVDLVFSPYTTPLTLAASEVTEPEGFVMLVCGASGQGIWNRGYRYVFGMYALADRYFLGFLDLIAREGIEDVSIIYEKNPFNIDTRNGALEWASIFGIKVKQVIGFNPGQDDATAVLDKIMDDPASALISCTYQGAGYKLLRLMSEKKSRPEYMAFNIIPTDPDFLEKAGPVGNRVFAPSQWEPVDRMPFPGTQEFISSFFDFTGKMPSYHATSAYASCRLMERAVTATHSLDNDRIRDFIFSLDTVTVLGRFKSDSTGKQIGHNIMTIQWIDGKKEIVYPPAMRTREPQW